MLKNRLCYLLVLFCTGTFFVCFNGYFSCYVFLLSLALPGLSLLASLPGMLTLRVTVSTPGSQQPLRPAKGQAAPLHVAAATRSVLPCGRARTTLSIHNAFTGEGRVEKLEFSPSRRPQILEHKLTCATCGMVQCRLSTARAYDLLGLFWLPVRLRRDSACHMIVPPTIHAPVLGLDQQPDLGGEGERYSLARPGDDPTELFGLRDYRPGDRLNRIDWKLSQKTGALLVKEASRPVTDRVLLLADLSGSGLEADALMDVLATLAHHLAGQEAGYLIGFARGERPDFLDISQPEDTFPALETVLCQASRQPLAGAFALSCPAGVSRVAYLCCEPAPGLVSGLEERYPTARLHLISLRPIKGREGLPSQAHWVRVRPGHIGEDLSGLLV